MNDNFAKAKQKYYQSGLVNLIQNGKIVQLSFEDFLKQTNYRFITMKPTNPKKKNSN